MLMQKNMDLERGINIRMITLTNINNFYLTRLKIKSIYEKGVKG